MKVVKTGRICWIPTVIKGILNYKRKDVADFKKRCYILFLNPIAFLLSIAFHSTAGYIALGFRVIPFAIVHLSNETLFGFRLLS